MLRWKEATFASICGLRLAGPVTGVRRQIGERRQAKLRRLRDDRVLRAGLRVDPERQQVLAAAGERGEQVRRHVRLGQSQERRLAAIDIHVQRRVIKRLLDAQVRDARDLVHARQQRVGVDAIGLDIEAGHLHVKRRGQTKVQDLTDDVRRQEGERGGRVEQRSASRAACARNRRSGDDSR